ncbi:hypothetical protein BB559_002272 [Furculomyces boomerangus]|uniref:ER membrane protein complex subunit 7 beta-sandwich domain-containing protein n=1 Tax=Furculomyces boomerangus TaxID=61424 RepID=A0A2T9YWU1_9FUNG|nr:hypothetical protein BB559_002272 [Furculomyces boomerangus]
MPYLIFSLQFLFSSADTSKLYKIRGKIIENEVLSDPSTLSPETRIILNGGQKVGFLQADGSFYINNVGLGEHTLEVENVEYTFPKLLLKIEIKDEKAVVSAWYYEPGYEYSLEAKSLPFPLKISALQKRIFIMEREGFNILGMFKNPYMLMVGVSMVIIFFVPKLQESMTEEEIEVSNQMFAKTKPKPIDFSNTLAQMTSGATKKQKK